MKIITLTLNPAFDVHCFAENFKPYGESIAGITSIEAGGKGVNISRALTSNGVDNLAVVVLGKDNGTEFYKALERDDLVVSVVWTEGRIRENITLHEKYAPETRISFDGFVCDKSVLREIKTHIGVTNGDTVVCFTGSAPNGVSAKDVKTLLTECKNSGARIVIDSRTFTLSDLMDFKPWLIKPNKDEAEKYTGEKIKTVGDAAKIAKKLFDCGVENVIVSLGGDGAVLACAQGVYYAKTPKINAVSTIGAGDSAIAGFLDGVVRGETVENRLRNAVSYGTAACMQEGTRPPKKEDVEKIFVEVKTEKLL